VNAKKHNEQTTVTYYSFNKTKDTSFGYVRSNVMQLSDLDSVGYAGRGLNVAERATLEITMAKKVREESLDEMLFWGKIFGTNKDYLICVGTKKAFSGVPEKKFYVCNGNALEQLPDISDAALQKINSFKSGDFTGDLEALLDEDTADGDEDIAMKEVHKLSAKVREIDFDVSIVPKNAYFVDATHQVLKNEVFKGLDHSAILSLDSYYHFREPVNLGRKSVLERRALVSSSQFLDPISEDKPKGAWSIQSSADRTSVSIRSLLWPGYFFSHKANQRAFGGAYFGSGKKNEAILLMN